MTEFTKDNMFSIGDVSLKTGMSARTIRYYEEIGLLAHPRRQGNRRYFTAEDVRRLKFIQRLKLLGLSLAEMAELDDIYRIHRSNDKVLVRLMELLDSHARRLDENVQDLINLRSEIQSYQERIQAKLQKSSQPSNHGEKS